MNHKRQIFLLATFSGSVGGALSPVRVCVCVCVRCRNRNCSLFSFLPFILVVVAGNNRAENGPKENEDSDT